MFKCVMKKMSRSFNVKLREISRVTNFQREISIWLIPSFAFTIAFETLILFFLKYVFFICYCVIKDIKKTLTIKLPR